MPDLTYVIRKGQAADGTPWWAVVGYDADIPLGADHHWLTLPLAQAALDRYEAELVPWPDPAPSVGML